MDTRGVDGVSVLLAGTDQAFRQHVSDALTDAEPEIAVTSAGSVSDALDSLHADCFDALVCTDTLDVRTLVEDATSIHPGLAVVVLADDVANTAADFADLDVTVLPRRENPQQYAALADRFYEEADGDSDYRELFEKAADAIFLHDPDSGEIVDANPRACEMTGYSREELIGSTVDRFTAVDEEYTLAAARERISKATTDGPQVFEWKNERKDGTTFWSEIRLKRTTIGGEDRVLAIARDVTERKEAEQTYRETFEAVADGLVVHDPDTGEILDVNDRFCEMNGYTREELVGATVDRITASDTHSYEEASDRIDAARTDGPQLFEWRNERKDGTEFPVEVHLAVVHVAGEERVLGSVRDITERKRRQRTLESLHDATETLTAVTDRERAAETTVDAATGILEFPFATVHLYDDTRGVLTPVAVETTTDEPDDLPAFEPGDRAWRAFVDGRALRNDDEPIYGECRFGDTLVLPLGEHGVFVLGDRDGFETDAVDAAQLLAARLEAGLNHVEGERELQARQQELEAQTERAQRLDRINTIVRDIEQALVDQSTREGVEQTVCDRLTAVEPYALAWVGERTVDGDSLNVRNRSTSGDDAGTPVDVAIEDATVGSHPGWRALETGNSQVVDSLVSERSQGPWRRQALTRGYQSCCAVALTYDGVTHGVLVVYADEPVAFEERERRVLEELGRSIGYAITTIERKRALESDAAIELDFTVTDSGLYFVALADALDARVSHERSVRRADGEVSLYCTVTNPDAGLEARPDHLDTELVSDRGDSALLEIRTNDWFGARFSEFGAVVDDAHAGAGEGELRVTLPKQADTRTVVERFQADYPATEFQAKRETEASVHTVHEIQDLLDRQLTDRQREVLETAYASGYFEWPREASGQDVAEMLDITQPTYNRHLRLAEAHVFSMLLDSLSEDD